MVMRNLPGRSTTSSSRSSTRPGPSSNSPAETASSCDSCSTCAAWRSNPTASTSTATRSPRPGGVVVPEREDCLDHSDLRDGFPFRREFATILTNLLNADQGCYEQVGGKFHRLRHAVAVERYVVQGYDSRASDRIEPDQSGSGWHSGSY